MAKKKQKKLQQQFLSPDQFLKQRARSLEIGTSKRDIAEARRSHHHFYFETRGLSRGWS
jgi:hypothetical protein